MKPGDYVLATKYNDGDPCDHFCVGFIADPPMLPKLGGDRFNVADADGNLFRGNGFRRCEVITAEEGAALVALFPSIGGKPGPSVWDHLARIRLTHSEGEDNETE
jgi:hypothetical protein